MSTNKVVLYANVGADLTHYDVNVEGAALIKRATVTLPAGVQYAWPHVSRRYLYVATSSSASGYGKAGTEHHVTAFRIDPASGALTPHGVPIRLPTRPIHMSTDIPSENILVAFNNPSALHVYRINKDFTPGEEVKQPGTIDAAVLADAILVLHSLFVLFVTGGFALVLLGAALRWSWVRVRMFRSVHLGAILLVAAESLVGVACPLTVWEDALRRAGLQESSFIGRWVARLLYYDFPEWMFAAAYCVFALAVALAWWLVPPRAARPHRPAATSPG